MKMHGLQRWRRLSGGDSEQTDFTILIKAQPSYLTCSCVCVCYFKASTFAGFDHRVLLCSTCTVLADPSAMMYAKAFKWVLEDRPYSCTLDASSRRG